MASTWTLNNAVEKIADGEKTDTWGQITNRNFDILDRAASGVGTIDLSGSGAAHSLSTTDGTTGDALSDGMYKVLVLSGATEACTITVTPNDASKFYLVDNNSGYDCTFTQGTGANATVANGSTGIIYCDGTGAAANVRPIIDATTLITLGITATAAELNVLDGMTATTAELNVLDGFTGNLADLNLLDITTLGTSQASKVVTADANNVITIASQISDNVGTVSSGVIDLTTGSFFSDAPSSNVTYSFTNPIASGGVSAFVLKVTPSSLITIQWPSSVVWNRGSAPNTTGSGETDVFVFYTQDGGTTYYGFQAGDDMS